MDIVDVKCQNVDVGLRCALEHFVVVIGDMGDVDIALRVHIEVAMHGIGSLVLTGRPDPAGAASIGHQDLVLPGCVA